MIRSMTAYALLETKGKYNIFTWEIRSVNQRHLEIYIRVPEHLRNLEQVIRKRMRQHLTRGKIECNLSIELDSSINDDLLINEILLKKLIKAINCIKIQNCTIIINPFDILRWPGIISKQEKNFDDISIELLQSFDNTLKHFINARENEGVALKILIEQRLEKIIQEITKIRVYMPEIIKWQRKRLITKFKDAKICLDNSRMEQELLILAQKIDIAEELDLLDAHIKETYNIIQKKETVGRHLEFMMQEFNREANTLTSKSINSEITVSAIEIKVLIEQIREQIQNIE